MSPQEYLDAVHARLSGSAGYDTRRTTLGSAPAVFGRRQEMRARWFFNKLKITVNAATVDRATLDGFNSYVADSWSIAQQYPGLTPMFSMAISIPVLAANAVDPDAAALARTKPPVHVYVGVQFPAIVNLTTGDVHAYDGFIYWAWPYLKFLRAQRALVTSPATT